MAYKPFGEKLNLDKDGNEVTKASFTNRGYTGHEHIQETDFINMNARLYDPTIGRFLSADSYIQAPYDTQSFNRYSYVMNNPLKYTDPSGFEATDLGIIHVVADPWPGFSWEEVTWWLYFDCDFNEIDIDYQEEMYYQAQAEEVYIINEAQEAATARNNLFNNTISVSALPKSIKLQPTFSTNIVQSEYSNSSSTYLDSVISWASTLDYHDALTALSVIPVVGGIAGAVDALSYVFNGEYSTAATMFALGFIPGGKLGMKVVGGLGKSTEVVQRWMSKAELQATRETGLIRGGRSGEHYVTDFANKNAQRARQRLALDHTPEVRVSLEVPKGVFSSPTKVKPLSDMSGGGMERIATGEIQVNILKVYE